MELDRRAHLLDDAVLDYHDPVGERHRFGLVCGFKYSVQVGSDIGTSVDEPKLPR
jgi:hypothetical protein